jgi:hypothetical protein
MPRWVLCGEILSLGLPPSALFVLGIIDNVKILARGSVNLKDARDRIAAVAGLVSHSGRDKGNFSRTQAILFPLHDRLDGPLQDDVNILGFSMVVRRTRSGIDVNQIDVHIDVLCAVGLIHETERFTAIPSHDPYRRVFYAHNLHWHNFTSYFFS